MKPYFISLSASFQLLVRLLNCSVVIELLCVYWTKKNKEKLTKRNTYLANNDADDDDATEQCQEEESGSAFDIHSGTAAMEAYDSGSSDDSGPYCNTFKCAPYYQSID